MSRSSGIFRERTNWSAPTFDVNREVEDCARLSEQARQEADDAVQAAKFREQARNRFIEEGRDPDDEVGTEVRDLSRTQDVDPRTDDRARCRACRVLGLDEYLHIFEIARRADHRLSRTTL